MTSLLLFLAGLLLGALFMLRRSQRAVLAMKRELLAQRTQMRAQGITHFWKGYVAARTAGVREIGQRRYLAGNLEGIRK